MPLIVARTQHRFNRALARVCEGPDVRAWINVDAQDRPDSRLIAARMAEKAAWSWTRIRSHGSYGIAVPMTVGRTINEFTKDSADR
jgi:hypothetical protein